METREQAVLNSLRDRFEADGFQYFPHPPRAMLPAFLGGFVPDAIALRDGEGVVVEVRTGRNRHSDASLADLAEKFTNRAGWRLEVVYEESAEAPPEKSPPSPGQLREHFNEATGLARLGHNRSAFASLWAVFEAAARNALRPLFVGRQPVRDPGALIEALEGNGLVDPGRGRELRSLLAVRNAVVHGDFAREVTSRDLTVLRDAAAQLIADEEGIRA